jgi:hypothetical protein
MLNNHKTYITITLRNIKTLCVSSLWETFLICVVLLYSTSSYAIDHTQYKTDAEELLNLNTTNINTATSQSTDEQLKETVPGFETSTPPETSYQNNSGAMETNSKILADNSEEGQMVTDSFRNRPDVKVDETDTFLIQSTATISNPETIINSVTSEYPECTETGGEVIRNTTTKTCDEYSKASTTSCSTGEEITIDGETKYNCKRYREYSTKSCKKELQATCTAYRECSTGGIELNTIATDLYWNYNYPNLSIGRAGGNYWRGWCATYDRTVTFNVASLDRIEYFILNEARFDDYMSVTINGHTIYVGPFGGTTLYVDRGATNNGIRRRSCELARLWVQYPKVDLKPYLKQGTNTLTMRVIVAGSGQGSMYFLLKNKCCTTVAEQWVEGECTTEE